MGIEYIIICKGIPKMKKKFAVNKTIELKIDDTSLKNIEQLTKNDIKDMFVISSDEWNKARIEESINNER